MLLIIDEMYKSNLEYFKFQVILKEILLALLVIGVVVLLIKCINRLKKGLLTLRRLSEAALIVLAV